MYLAIYSSSQTCAPWGLATEDSLGARGAAARVVPDALLRGALTAATALPWGPASRRRGTDNELLARLPAQLASVEPAGSAGARTGSSAWARGGEQAPGLLSLRVPE